MITMPCNWNRDHGHQQLYAAASMLLMLLAMELPPHSEAHGFLSVPNSRQKYAADNGKWWCSDQTANDCFLKESEPQSASRLAPGDFCGVSIQLVADVVSYCRNTILLPFFLSLHVEECLVYI